MRTHLSASLIPIGVAAVLFSAWLLGPSDAESVPLAASATIPDIDQFYGSSGDPFGSSYPEKPPCPPYYTSPIFYAPSPQQDGACPDVSVNEGYPHIVDPCLPRMPPIAPPDGAGGGQPPAGSPFGPYNPMSGQAEGAMPGAAEGIGEFPLSLDSPYVDATNGVMTRIETDLHLPGTGLDFLLIRSYRSNIADFDGQYGAGWQFNINRRVFGKFNASGDMTDMIFVDGSGYPDRSYQQDGSSEWWLGADPGQYFEFVNDPADIVDTMIRHLPNGGLETYVRLDPTQDYFFLDTIEDAYGNELIFSWQDGLQPDADMYSLIEVVDTRGREIEFHYETSTGDHGMLEKVKVLAPGGGSTLGEILYEIDESTQQSGTYVLEKVTGLKVATEGAGGALSEQSVVTSYGYDEIYTGSDLHLISITNGVSKLQHKWEYQTDGRVKYQWDRYGATTRDGQSEHYYNYNDSVTTTEYTGPDGELRDFVLDGNGRIKYVREYFGSTRTSSYRETKFTYGTGCTCGQVTKIEFGNAAGTGVGRVDEFEYDSDGNLTSLWRHPISGSGLPSIVERWTWSTFDPRSSLTNTRIIYHELQRAATSSEVPGNDCNHPTCDDNANASGHQVHTFSYSDGISLTEVDYGSIQTGINASGGSVSTARKEAFEYFANGILKKHTEIEGGSTVSEISYTLDATTGDWVASATLTDTASSATYTQSVGYDAWGRLNSVTPHSGVTTSYLLDDTGRPYQIKEAAGTSEERVTKLWYNAAGWLVKTISGDGTTIETTEYTLDEVGVPTKVTVTGPGGTAKATDITMSKSGYLLKTKDWRGYELGFEWDGKGALRLPTKRWEKWGSASQRTLWESGDGGSGDGYDDSGRLEASRNAAGWITKYTFDGHSRLKQLENQRGTNLYRGSTFNYDARGFVKEIETGADDGTGPTLFQHHAFVYNTHGHQIAHAVYEDSAETIEARMQKTEVDTRGRTVKTVGYVGDKSASTPTLSTTEYGYDALDRVVLATKKVGGTTVETTSATYYDTSGYVETVVTGAGSAYKDRRRTHYDKLDRAWKSEQWEWTGSAYGASRDWQRTIDALDRVTEVSDPLGVKNQWTYDELHRITHSKRISSGSEPLQDTEYHWDLTTDGTLDKVTDAEGSVTDYTYDSQKRIQKVEYPDGRHVEYSGYDNLGRPDTIKEYASSTATPITRALDWDYDRLKSDALVGTHAMVFGPDTKQWGYDSTGRLKWSQMRTGGTSGTVNWRTDYTINDLGELTWEKQGGPGGNEWSFEYGYVGEMLAADYPSALGLSRAEYTFDGAGRWSDMVFKSGASTVADYDFTYSGMRMGTRTASVADLKLSLDYDAYGRLDSAIWSDISGGGSVQLDGQERLFDKANRVIGRKRAITGESTGDAIEHDGFGRMKKWYRGASTPLSYSGSGAPTSWTEVEEYELNKVYGRKTLKTTPSGGSTSTATYTSNDAHFYSSVVEGGTTETRTKWNGRLIGDGTYTYRYDAWGRLIEVHDIANNVTIREHLYDARGRRVEELRRDASTGSTSLETRFVYMGMALAGSYDVNQTSKVRTYSVGGGADSETFVRVQGESYDGYYEFVRDFQGTILALVNRSDQSVVERYRYSPFGEVSIESGTGTPLSVSAYGNERMFMGRLWDAEVGIYDVRARWYEPDRGAFLGPDPLGAVDSWNSYQYGYGTPGTWNDPSGLSGGFDFGRDIGGLFGDSGAGMAGHYGDMVEDFLSDNPNVTIKNESYEDLDGAVVSDPNNPRNLTIYVDVDSIVALGDGGCENFAALNVLFILLHEIEHAKDKMVEGRGRKKQRKAPDGSSLPSTDISDYRDDQQGFVDAMLLREAWHYVGPILDFLDNFGDVPGVSEYADASAGYRDYLPGDPTDATAGLTGVGGNDRPSIQRVANGLINSPVSVDSGGRATSYNQYYGKAWSDAFSVQ